RSCAPACRWLSRESSRRSHNSAGGARASEDWQGLLCTIAKDQETFRKIRKAIDEVETEGAGVAHASDFRIAQERYRMKKSEARQIYVNYNPTASLYSALCLTPFSVRQIGTVIAPLHPGHKLEDRLNRIRAQG